MFSHLLQYRAKLLRMRNILDNNCRENQSTYFMLNNFFPKSRALYEIMSKNGLESKATNDFTI